MTSSDISQLDVREENFFIDSLWTVCCLIQALQTIAGRGSSFLTKHVQNNLMVWSFSKTNEENVEIAECLKDIMLEFLNVFPSSHKELPLDTFKTFLIDCGETKFDKEVCCQYCFLRR